MSQKAFTIPGPVGINTDTPSTVFEVVAGSTSPDAIIRIRETQSFPTFDGSGSGLELIVGEANTTNKFTPAIKFGSVDSAFTTTTPKFGAAITASAAQTYGLDTNGGMDLGIWTAPTNPGTGSGLVERINVKSNGQVSIGGITNFGGTLEVFSTGSGTPNSWISMTRGSSDASGPYLALVKSRSTDPLLRTAVLLNDDLGSIVFQGTNGTTNLVGAAIKSITAAAPTSTNIQANLIFSTTNSTDILPSERMRITSVGDVGIGTGSPSAKVEITNSTAGYGSLQLKLSNVGGGSGDDSRITLHNGTIASALVLRSNTHATEPNDVVLSASGANDLLFYTNGGERVRINSDGNLYVGLKTSTAAPYYAGTTVDSLIQITQTSLADAAVQINRYDTTNAAATPLLVFTRSRGAVDVNTVVQNGDSLGALSATGATGSNYREATRILSQVDSSTITSSSLPGRLVFMTTGTADTSPIERMRIASTGYVHIGAAGVDPVFPFQVVTASTQTSPMMSLRSTTSAAIGAGGGLVLQGNTNGTGAAATFAGIVGAKENATAGNTAGYLLFAVNNGSNSTERMRITSTGAIALSGATNTGTTGQALLSNGSDAAAWGNVSATSLSGQVPAANGGTGLNITGSGVVVYSSGVGALTSTTGTGSVVLSAAPTLTGLVTASGSMGVGTSSPFTTIAVNAGKTAENTNATGVYGSAILGTTTITASRAVTGVNGTASSNLLNATAFSPYVYGGNFSSNVYGGNTTEIGSIYGIISSASFSPSNATYNKFAFVYGSSIAAAVSGSTAQVGELTGQKFSATVGTGSTASTVKGVDAAFTITGTATDAYGVYSQVRTNTGGTVTNSYAFYGGISTSGTITNRYGIFIAGNTGNNYFGDALQVGGGAITGSSSAGVGIGVTPTGTVGSLRVSDAIYTTNGVSTTHTGALYYTGGSYRLEALGASVPMVFATNGSVRATIDTSGILNVGGTVTGDAKIQSPNGIRIGGTASSDANTLDYYQEGTWTPTVVGTTTAGTGTYSTQYGSYTRIGNRVQFSAVIQLSAHTGTGNIRISGLPFTSTSYAQVVNIMSQNLTFTGQLSAYVVSSTSNIELIALVSNATWNPVMMDTVFNLWVNGIYQVA